MKLAIILACIVTFIYAQFPLTAEQQEQLKKDPRCRIPCAAGQVKKLSHPYDCTKYTECRNGVVTFKDCPSGYKFSTGLKACEHSAGGAGQGCLACFQRRPVDY
ncbi:uncharacterized protein LOC107045446 [Diachasma alloeum]|uniref:uncharacterized protein LOC107045446 n=1 Tax=Diachasma alloeum TaxID=454923 RepID=UPI0007384FB1|nr:uncharacterized protein LOC107045446 [Diachasma alloeum]